jgi:hypothetical protein
MARPYEHLTDKELIERLNGGDQLALAESAHRYRLQQAVALLVEFASWHVRPPASIEELEAFAAGPFAPRRTIR